MRVALDDPHASNGRALLMELEPYILSSKDLILVTGASGFIGTRVVESLLKLGFRNLRCFVRPSSNATAVADLIRDRGNGANVELVRGNLLSREDCALATRDAKVILHLAAGRGEKSFPDAFMNSVVTTRNLLDSALLHNCLRRFVNVSSFSVYANAERARGRPLDESCPVETRPELRGEAYCYSKVKQDEIVQEYGERFAIPYVIVRPGYVYGPGNLGITGRVGIGTFGLFLHLGGANTVPFTYVDNCAEAIVLAGVIKGINGEVLNVVDDDLPSSRVFLRLYKQKVRPFRSLYVPHPVSYLLCYFWERYSHWSKGQLLPSFNRRKWHSYWRKTRYSNEKLKMLLGWRPRVPTGEGLERYFDACRQGNHHA